MLLLIKWTDINLRRAAQLSRPSLGLPARLEEHVTAGLRYITPKALVGSRSPHGRHRHLLFSSFLGPAACDIWGRLDLGGKIFRQADVYRLPFVIAFAVELLRCS